MTKKDFELIASVIARAETVAVDGDPPGPAWYAEVFAEELKKGHPRFDAAKFEHYSLPLAAHRKKQAIMAGLATAEREKGEQSDILHYTRGIGSGATHERVKP